MKIHRDHLGVLAAVILSLACLIAAAYHVKIILELKHYGITVPAKVVAIEHGAKNSKMAVYQYRTISGREMKARDKFLQYVVRVHKGESVRVIYHREDVRTVTADLGIYIWQAPLIFFAGFMLVGTLAFLIWRNRAV